MKRLHKNKCKWTINIYLKLIHIHHFKNASPNNFMAFFSYQNIRQHLFYIFHNFDVCGEADTSTHHCWEYKFLKLNVPGKKVILSSSSPQEEIWVKSLRWQISSINYGQCNSIGELGVGFYHDQ